jgi:hypothetical protein
MWPYEGRKRSVQGAGGETRGEETAGETKAYNGRIILGWTFRRWD